ncbi:Aste57867_8857 [Aphanomyces stellatus]|uniref:Aste57867_8857 protein n=1 Tax=Aphanomyces stellatus TaxID=120398 RepID=A0A485KLJ6_9STRA|nr:hypothetical protein As57867_008822 [Aphanomyces stellatus]VFT85743.1 Aste57867_8857 [Aphanomyces stellatus]
MTTPTAHYATLLSPRAAASSDSTAPPSLHRRILHIPVDDVMPSSNDGRPSFLYPARDATPETFVVAPADELDALRAQLNRPKHLLGAWVSTAICGNDILSSVSYSAAIVAVKAGTLAPLAFLLVSLVLYMFRFVYEEAVTAIPLNGGSYNLLLNTTSKRVASFAACLSILCYTATAVVSASTACYYLQVTVPDVHVVGLTIALLAFFAMLMLIGINESSVVATAIFVGHVITLSILLVVSLVYTVRHPDVLRDNYRNTTYPDVDMLGKSISGNFATALFFGFSAAMLGVTGFETSSNFVEEQQPGVFRQTLRNMWAISSFYNIVLCVLCFGVLPLEGPTGILAHQNAVLAQVGLVAAGTWCQWLVAIDSFVVLSGAVLTGYVGITGLLRRLAADRVMPAFFGRENTWRRTNHWIILVFFGIATSLVVLLNADTLVLSGVYTYSFLSLMFLFGSGCLVLKLKRPDVPRAVRAPLWCCVGGMSLVAIGFFGNLLGDPKTLSYFALYFIFVVAVIFLMLERVHVLRVLIAIINVLCTKNVDKEVKSSPSTTDDAAAVPPLAADRPSTAGHRRWEHEGPQVSLLVQRIKTISTPPIIFFAKQANLTVLNKAILYARHNEITHHLRIVHVYDEATPAAMANIDALQEMVALYDHIYPKLRTDFFAIRGAFEPAMIEWISHTHGVPTNMMFIKQPTNAAVHQVSSRGVRVITA